MHAVVHLDADAVARALGLDAPPECWRGPWDRSADYPLLAGVLDSEANLLRWCRWAAFSEPIVEALVHARPALADRPELMRLVRHYHWLLYAYPQGNLYSPDYMQWPMLSAENGAISTLFYPLMFVAALPRMRLNYRLRRIDYAVARATIADMELWMHEHRRKFGTFGLQHPGWISLHLAGRLMTLGRLQFERCHYHRPFVFFRHRDDGRVIALADDGGRFRPDGQFASAEGTPVDSAIWTSRFEHRDGLYIGHPVDARGQVQQQVAHLPDDEWRPALSSGDPVLSVHIPATGPMAHDACTESFRRACEFFPRHYPDHPFRAFVCFSWLLDPQLGDYLPASTNLVKFLKRWHLLPLEHTRSAYTFQRVFGRPDPDLSSVPQDTLLRRIVAQHALDGGYWRGGGGVLFMDEV